MPRPVHQLGPRFFAVPAGARRDRRPTDVTMLVLAFVVFVVFAFRAGSPTSGLEASVSLVVANLPSFLDPIWNIFHDGLIVWSLVVVLVAVLRRQWGLCRDLLVAAVLVPVSVAVAGRLANGSWPSLVDGLFGTDPVVDYPAVGLALWVALTSVASSHLSRPYRYFSRWVAMLGGFASFALGITTPSGSVGAASLGLAVAAGVHLIFGSPGGLPSFSQVRDALAGVGIDAEVLDVTRRSGLVLVRARDDAGTELDVKVYGRDAWDGQLLVSLWRFVWYRNGGPTLAVTRLQQVEHEAFLTLLAERRGASVHPVLAAGEDSLGDALLVVRRDGRPLAEVGPALDDGLRDAMWRELARLHKAGITHGSIDSERLFVDVGKVSFADLSSSDLQSSTEGFLIDRAQLLVTTAVAIGTDRAIAGALGALGVEGLADVASYVQPAALPTSLRREVSAADLDVDDIRAAAVAAAGVQARDLQKLRRLTWGRVFMAVIIFVAASTLISSLLDVGIDNLVAALQEASIPIVIAAYFVSSTARCVTAVGVSALSPIKVPLSRLTTLQFAMTFVNLAMPSTAGRVAVNIRFFQRSGVEPTAAVAIGAIDSFTGFVSQMILMGSILLFGLGTLEFNLDDTDSLEKITSLLWIFGIAIVVALVLVVVVPPLRRRVLDVLQRLRVFLGPLLRTPQRLMKALAANLVGELLGAGTLYVVLLAYDQSVSYIDIVLVSIGVSLFAGLMPVPGGIGVTEAALTAGFIAAGVPETIAFAAALTCRIVTFYFPPTIGYFAFRSLQRQKYL